MGISSDEYFLGVDVGTGSVRAVLTDSKGQLVAKAVKDIVIHNPRPDFYLHSSRDVWNAAVFCLKKVVTSIDDGDRGRIKGLGFAATCCLAVVNTQDDGSPPVQLEQGQEDTNWDIIMWMDHRADRETAEVNATKHKVLDFVGGSMSLEMQTPKLLWIKRNLPQIWRQEANVFFDLPDFLTYKVTPL